MDIRDNESLHRYELSIGDAVAFSQYVRQGQVTDFIHTEVPKSLSGKGIGSKLIRGALDNERAQGRKVIAHCPFVAKFIREHTEYQDLLTPAARAEAEKAKLDAELDEALTETFPASDSPAVTPKQ
ncbi:MAG TPA: GNAT family N-acetyltransferase [Rhizomicrobium sp.]|nr:GNAT family N-acetyltransferase [Rhizomicrobium sp.]